MQHPGHSWSTYCHACLACPSGVAMIKGAGLGVLGRTPSYRHDPVGDALSQGE
jgi:hypothetical protein